MKRPLMCAAGGFVLGEVCLLLPKWLGIGILAGLCVGVCYLWIEDEREGASCDTRRQRERKGGSSLLWWILPLFCVLGMVRLQEDGRRQAEYQQLLSRWEGLEVRLEGDVRKLEKKEKSWELELKKVSVYVEGEENSFSDVLVYVKPQDPSKIEDIRMGMRIAVWGQLEDFEEATNPGQFDLAGYYHSMGYEGRMYGEYVQMINWNYSPYYHFIACLRNQTASVLELICTKEDLGIFQAVLLGDKGELDEGLRELYQRNGIAHLLAVSGLHVSLIGLGCYHLLRRLGLGFDGSGFIAALVTVSYGVLTGGTASVVRAVIMALFQIAADKLGRTYDLLSAMAFAALSLLMESPTLLFQSGFQLSFGALLAIGAVNPIVVGWLCAERRWEKTIVLSFVIQLVTYPIIVYHFFEYPVYGIVLNLLVIPLMSYVVVSGLVGVVIASGWLDGGIFAIGTGHYVLALYEWLCLGFQQLPGAVWIVGRPKLWQIAAYAVVWSLILAWMYQNINQRKLQKQEDTISPISENVIAAVKRCGLLLTFLAGIFSLRCYAPADLEVTFLDVGQGDGAFFQTREVSVLVDGGSTDNDQLGDQILEPFLKSKGVSHIDYAVVSHADQDHISGLICLFQSCEEITIGHLVLPWRGKEEEGCGKLQELAEAVGTKVLWMRSGNRIQKEDLVIRCLYAGEGLESQERNDHSPLLEVVYDNVGILLTGDMSEEGEMQWLGQKKLALSGKQRILKAAHHGSKYSTSEAFLQTVQPKVTVISCGEDNSYGHPHQETLERLKAVGSQVMVTKDCGAVIVEVGDEVKIYGFGR